MAKIQEKQQAQQLRLQGESIKSIARQLGISQSTVSVWCRDVVLSDAAKEKLLQNTKARNTAGLLAYSEKKRKDRLVTTRENHELGKLMLVNLSKRDVFCIGLGLYWGEGYKQGNREFGFTNSDPKMITFYMRWLNSVFSVKTADLTLRVSINGLHTERITEVESYWSKLTGVPLEQFTKPSLIKTTLKKTFENADEHFGTLRIKVRGGSDLREQILGAIAAVSEL